MQSNFEKSQASKILSCYEPDLIKGGKRATIGEVRVWGGIKHVKLPNGEWGLVDDKTKEAKIVKDSRKVVRGFDTKSKDKKTFSTDQVILDEISKFTPEQRKEKVAVIDKQINFLKEKYKVIDLVKETGYDVESLSESNSINDKIKKLTNKKYEIQFGGLSQSQLQSKIDGLQQERIDLLEANGLKRNFRNVTQLMDIEKKLTILNHVHYRKFNTSHKDSVLGGNKSFFDINTMFNDNTPWTEDDYDYEENSADLEKFKNDKFKKAKKDLEFVLDKKAKSVENLKNVLNKPYIQDEDPIEVTFTDNKIVERTWKDLKNYVIKESQDGNLQKILPIQKIIFK